jgi:hypothetical protein
MHKVVVISKQLLIPVTFSLSRGMNKVQHSFFPWKEKRRYILWNCASGLSVAGFAIKIIEKMKVLLIAIFKSDGNFENHLTKRVKQNYKKC